MILNFKKFKEWVDFACAKNKVKNILKTTEIYLSDKMTSTAGIAYISDAEKKIIKLSKPILSKSTEVQARNIIIHETCHIIVYDKFGEKAKAHGIEWKETMLLSEEEPNIYHSVQPETKIYRDIKAQCLCKEFKISKSGMNLLLNKTARCIFCRGKIKILK